MNNTAETEEIRWQKTIIKYRSEIQNSMKVTDQLIEKGYVQENSNIVEITDKGIGFIEAKLDSAKIPEAQLNAFDKFIESLFELDEQELDIMACTEIYKKDYKAMPSEKSLTILRKILSQKDACDSIV